MIARSEVRVYTLRFIITLICVGTIVDARSSLENIEIVALHALSYPGIIYIYAPEVFVVVAYRTVFVVAAYRTVFVVV